MRTLTVYLFVLLHAVTYAQTSVGLHEKFQLELVSDRKYDNPLYDVREFTATFTSPSGREWTVDGFWDGERDWKVRFRPDELGSWAWKTTCSDAKNSGLNDHEGIVEVTESELEDVLHTRGPVGVRRGDYHLSHADGTPFFWTGCTAWNGALKSTPAGWETYLSQRSANDYNLIHYVTTQWRGGERNAEGQQAYGIDGGLRVNPEFFRRIDLRTDAINDYGMVAAPILLWALPVGDGRHLSPGYVLPLEDAVILARYIVARLQGNHVIWTLGGDGKYIEEYEQRWREIGRRVFSRPTQSPVTNHPQGTSWTGEVYADTDWIDILGYQSSHSNRRRTVDWITQGPPSQRWDRLPARPTINMEPNYEEINFVINARDVRNASYWSVFATPPAGITYGANGIWPWIQQPGELIENHRNPDGRGPSTWRESIDFPGSLQIGHLHRFMGSFDWWELRPAQQLLRKQPGLAEATYNHFISVLADPGQSTVLVYVPRGDDIELRLANEGYSAQWFDPRNGETTEPKAVGKQSVFSPPSGEDWVLVLKR